MSRIALTALTLLIAVIAVPIATAGGEAASSLNRVEFQVQAGREVDNDLTRVVLVAEDEHSDPARLAAAINRTMARALQQARATDGLRVSSGQYRTTPVYDQRRLTHWRASQELRLEGADSEVINRLVGELQAGLQVRSMSFAISPPRRQAVIDELTGEALDGFRARAAAITARLGAGGYDIVALRIDDGGHIDPPGSMVRAMAAPESVPVATEAGSSHITVAIHAVIALHD